MDVLPCHPHEGRIDPDRETLLMGMEDHACTMGIQPGLAKAREGKTNIPGDTLDTPDKVLIGQDSRASQFLMGPDEG